MTQDELQFFAGHGAALPIYTELRSRVFAQWPDVEVRVARTQITFKARYGFAFVSTRRMGRRCPEVFIIVSFGLHREVSSPRILAASEPYPGRWTHHLAVAGAQDIDDELLALTALSHAFALSRAGGG